jgi:hypothetical protein
MLLKQKKFKIVELITVNVNLIWDSSQQKKYIYINFENGVSIKTS